MHSLSAPIRKALLAQDMSSPIQNAGGGSNPVRRLSLCRIISNYLLGAKRPLQRSFFFGGRLFDGLRLSCCFNRTPALLQ